VPTQELGDGKTRSVVDDQDLRREPAATARLERGERLEEALVVAVVNDDD
jgi:hypothetical protein